ncbi:MAG: HAMP domain-containing sensor histidine kinase [Lentimicrobiaceae bacterium]|jgi:signal transduction histidine kinase
MNNKQLFLKDNSRLVNISSFGKNSNFKTTVFASENESSNASEENKLSLRLKELEEVNAQLKILMEVQTAKLDEVVATNAKFLSVLAHDLRSPFQSIIGALDLLQDGYNDYDEIQIETYINMATNSANTTLRLLENLLSWTSLQNTEKNFNPVKIDLHEVVLSEIESVSSSATQKLITLNHTVKPKLFVTADLQMVKTILRNLINNAIKYSYLGGEIIISAIGNDKCIEIDVIDNGVGISQNVQRDLFQHTELYSTRGTKNEYGTGLGLMICKEFVEMHGGNIRIESEPGKGSKIRFTLPHSI